MMTIARTVHDTIRMTFCRKRGRKPYSRIGYIASCMFAGFCGAHSTAQAAVLFNGAYSQNFDSLSAQQGQDVQWTHGTTLTGWYSSEASYHVLDDAPGGAFTRRFFSFGSQGATDRALGASARPGATTGPTDVFFGIELKNQTFDTITNLKIRYTGEQWSSRDNNRQSLFFQFSTTATALVGAGATFTAFDTGKFNSPKTGFLGKLDGNAAGNNVVKTLNINNLNIANGSTFWIRWQDVDTPGIDHGLGIDDVSIEAFTNISAPPPIPEPSPLGMFVVGIVSVGARAWWMRRSTKLHGMG